MERKQKVVIIGHGYTSRLGVIRSLAELDCDITVIAISFHRKIGRLLCFEWGKPIDCYSRFVNRVIIAKLKDGNDLVDLLLSRCADPKQKTIIIPDSDFSAAAVDNNQQRLKDYFIFPNIRRIPGAVEYWMNKYNQKLLASDLGLNVVKDCVIAVCNGLYEIPECINYPCFLKPVTSLRGGKQFLRRCDSQSDLDKALSGVRKKFNNAEMLVEDYMEIGNEYAVVGFSDGKHIIIPGVIEFSVNSKSHFGIAREGKIAPIDGFEGLLEKFKLYVSTIGFCGLFDIDFYESGGNMFFSEINLRYGGSGYAYTAMGCNLPAMLVRSFKNESIDDMNQQVKTTALFVNERMCIDDWSFYHITEREMNCIIKSADIRFVYDENDLGPQKKLGRYIHLQRVKRVVRRTRKYIKKCLSIDVYKNGYNNKR